MSHEREIADLEQRTEELQDRIDDVRADWERKRRDSSVPGAPAPTDDPEAADGGAIAGDWEGEAQAADRAGQ